MWWLARTIGISLPSFSFSEGMGSTLLPCPPVTVAEAIGLLKQQQNRQIGSGYNSMGKESLFAIASMLHETCNRRKRVVVMEMSGSGNLR